jgi:threonine aldolase
VIDLRSDFCAPPTEEMWEAMRAAEIGWPAPDGPDTVAELERRGAELLGKEAGLFTATCSQANLVALLALSSPGDRVALAPASHVIVNEGGWLTEVTRLVPVGLDDEARLSILENTHTYSGGTVLSSARTRELAARAERVHLDGARLPNAAVAEGVSPAELAAPAETVALSLNKGLCAPYGALLAGPAETIAGARRHLRQLGGGTVHKAAVLAAAGLVALGLVERIADDHRRARGLAELLGLPPPETNLVLTELDEPSLPDLAARGVLAFAPGGGHVRLVTHRGIGDADVEQAAEAVLAVQARSSAQ